MTPVEATALARVLVQAAGRQPRVSPNPAVGCAIVRGERVVATGVTEPPPGRHAEVVALTGAGDAARGATAVVTLEPCAHHGRTPPCTEALAAAGIARVVLALADPNPVATGGAVRLRAAGIEVVGPLPATDPLPGSVARSLEGFLHVVRTGRPHLTLKLAQTVDGATVHPEGQRWLTGPAARAAVHRLRAAVDGVLVGSGTVLADDPGLDVRHVAADHQPRVVVLDARLRTPVTARVVRPGSVVVTVTAPPGGDRAAVATHAAVGRRLEAAGVTLVAVPPGLDGGVDLPAALTALAERGMVSLLAEPGPTLSGALLAAGLVDRLVRHVAVHLGGGADRTLRVPPPGTGWCLERSGGAGTDAIVSYHRTTGDPAP